MFKIVALAALLAVAAAAPGLVGYSGLPVASTYAYGASPYAYGASPYAYGAYNGLAGVAAPLAYSGVAHAPVAYSAAAIPAPVTYASGYKVAYAAEPVEQHGYKIAY